jgi:hypothetical protein
MSPDLLPLDERPAVTLHIGMGKTGTTSIQTWLHHNRDRLVTRGVLYPESLGRLRHARLGMAVQPAPRPSLDWQRPDVSTPEELRPVVERELLEEIRAAAVPHLLLSDEALLGTPDGAISNLRGLLGGMASSVRTVVYLRRQDDHLCSRYQQVVKRGGTVQRLAERVDEMQHAPLYDYRARLDAWRRLLRPTELVVRRFERSSFAGGSLFQDFLGAAGLDIRADELDEAPVRNESLDAECVEFFRILNLHQQREGPIPGLPRPGRIARRLQPYSTGPVLTLPEDRLDGFMAQWQESNRAVAREYFPDGPDTLFESGRKVRGTTTEQRLDPARLDHFFAVLDLPVEVHASLRAIAEHEAARWSGRAG